MNFFRKTSPVPERTPLVLSPVQRREYLPVSFKYTKPDGSLWPIVLYYSHETNGPCSFQGDPDIDTMIAISGNTGLEELKDGRNFLLKDKIAEVMLCLPSAEKSKEFEVCILKKGDENHPDRRIQLPGRITLMSGESHAGLCVLIRTELEKYIVENYALTPEETALAQNRRFINVLNANAA